jgi:hypothetical protein
MKRKGIEQNLVIVLFVLVLVVFSLAERDSKKLDRLYKTAQLLQKNNGSVMVQLHPAPGKLTSK